MRGLLAACRGVVACHRRMAKVRSVSAVLSVQRPLAMCLHLPFGSHDRHAPAGALGIGARSNLGQCSETTVGEPAAPVVEMLCVIATKRDRSSDYRTLHSGGVFMRRFGVIIIAS